MILVALFDGLVAVRPALSDSDSDSEYVVTIAARCGSPAALYTRAACRPV